MKDILHETLSGSTGGRWGASARFVPDVAVQGTRVLDIGCGYGWFESMSLSRGVASIVGMELSDADLAIARAAITDPRVTFVTGGASSIPFPDASFDTVVSWEVIEHVPKGSEPAMFEEIRRVLKPGGTFYLSTPHRSFWSNACDPAWWLLGHRHYPVDRLKGFGERAGFEVTDVQVLGGRWVVLAALNMYVSKWIFRRPPFGASFFERKTEPEYRTDGFAGVFMAYRRL